jgi:hypothetical protein
LKLSDITNLLSRPKLGLRLGALVLALVLWIFVVSNNNYFMVLTVPIEVRNLSVQKALREEVPKVAQVRFYGSGRSLFKAYLLKGFYDEFKLVLDLEKISDEYDFILNEYYKEFPQKVVVPSTFGIQYIEVVYPTEIKISLDEYLVKRIPVIPDVSITTEPGYVVVGDINVRPDSATVAGPMEIISDLNLLRTESDTISLAAAPVMRQIALRNLGNLVQFSPENITYDIDVQAISERIVSEVPVNIENVLPGYRVFVSPQTVSLTIIGGVNRIIEIEPENIGITIDFGNQWNSEVQFYEPSVTIPEGVIDWQDLSPRNLELIVTRETN